MNFKKTIIVSVFFHFFFFTAALLLSADLSGGSSEKHNGRVFFVNLAEDMNKSDMEQSRNRDMPVNIETEKAIFKKSVQLKVKKKPISEIQKKTDTIKRENLISSVVSEDADDFQSKTVPVEPVNILSVQETAVYGSYNSFSHGDGMTSEGKGKGVLHKGIIEIIRNSIERVKTYPVLARKRGMEGIVYISFRINPYGKPQDIKILKSSGYRILDKTTLDVVKKAAPFPYLDNFIEVPVVFRLRN